MTDGPDILGHLVQVTRNGTGWIARCPCHEDRDPSLSISWGDRGVVLHCFGCGADGMAVCGVLGIDPKRYLWLGAPEGNGSSSPLRFEDAVARYPYAGFTICRFVVNGQRQLRPFHESSPGEWRLGKGGARSSLYRFDELLRADTIWITEGEKDADRLRSLGMVATTNPFGGGNWLDVEDRQRHFAGKEVIVVEDNDATGRQRTNTVTRDLEGVATSIRVVRFTDMPEGSDVSDFLDAGGNPDSLSELATEIGEPERWDTRTLIEALRGDYQPPERGILFREDGEGLLYPRQVTGLVAEPEAGKTMVAYVAMQTASLSMPVVLIDFEMGPVQAAERFMLLGVNEIGDNWTYAWNRPIADVVAAVPEGAFVVIDATDGGFAHLELDPNSTKDANTFKATVIDALKAKGCTVLLLDHASTSRQERKRGAMGSTKKLGNVDVSLYVKVEAPGTPGHVGKYQVYVDKDRSAQLRGISDRKGDEDHLTTMQTETVGGVFRVDFLNPRPFRPTYLMEQVSRFLEGQTEAQSKSSIENGVKGKATVKRMALDLLVKDGYVELTVKGQTHFHRSLHPYREASDSRHLATVPRPQDADETSESDHSPGTTPTPSPVDGGDGVQSEDSQPRRDGVGRGRTDQQEEDILGYVVDVFDAEVVADNTRSAVGGDS